MKIFLFVPANAFIRDVADSSWVAEWEEWWRKKHPDKCPPTPSKKYFAEGMRTLHDWKELESPESAIVIAALELDQQFLNFKGRFADLMNASRNIVRGRMVVTMTFEFELEGEKYKIEM